MIDRLVLLSVFVLSASSAPAQSTGVTGLSALHRSGQTFLTWDELGLPDVRYRVYRSAAPILDVGSATLLGEVDGTSSENVRHSALLGAPSFFRIEDLASPLAGDQGLFVHTVTADEAGYYAVTAVLGGVEDTAVTRGENALLDPIAEVVAVPRPVLQSIAGSNRHYVHWVSAHDAPLAPAMWIRPSRAFNFRVVFDPTFSGPRPVMLRLHARGGNFQLPGEFSHPETVVLSPDDWIGESPTNTFWYGLNEAFPDTTQYASHLNVDYTVRRVMAELDFVLDEPLFEADPHRVYASGGSMGGVGACFFGYRYPNRFAAIHATIPKFDFGCSEDQCWLEPENGDLLWGTVAQNLPTTDGIGVYDRLDLGFLATWNSDVDLPLLTAWNGRNDVVVGWPEKPPTYATLTAARAPVAFFWDEREHGGGGAWGFVMNQRRNALWSYRLDQAVPAFSNLSIDDDPGDGDPDVGDPVGTINGYVDWEVASIEDTPNHHSLEVSLRNSVGLDDSPSPTATVDWTPRRLQSFPRTPGATYRFRNTQLPSGTEVENRVVVANAAGVITVTAAVITQAGNEYRLEVIATAQEFRRGDANQDGAYDLGDAISTLSYLFASTPTPPCLAAVDATADDAIDLADAIFTLSYLFALGPPPPPPGPFDCGAAPGSTGLGCLAYPCP